MNNKLIAGSIDISSLIKAKDVFERFRVDMKDDRDEAGAVQAFEFTYELAWKTLKRVLEILGVIVSSPRETFRAAAVNNLITDPEEWFYFMKMRNLTSHVYREETLDEVIQMFDSFSKELTVMMILLQNLK
jgi:nucleotidyltransferase substrate binding protein (TIGR01987 family)